MLAAGGQAAHLGQPPGRVSVVLDLGLDQFVDGQTLEDGQHRQRVDFLVFLDQFFPCRVVGKAERVRQIPRRRNVFEGE